MQMRPCVTLPLRVAVIFWPRNNGSLLTLVGVNPRGGFALG